MEQVYNRINDLCEELLASLPPTYKRNVPGPKAGFAFALTRKHTAALPNPGGVHYWQCGAITLRGLIALVSHQTNDDLVMVMLRRILVDGEDEGLVVQENLRNAFGADTGAPPAAVADAEIAKRVEIEVRKYIEKLAAAQDKKPAAAKVEKPPVAKKQIPSKKDILASVWEPRAAEMDEKVKLSNIDPTLVDGRWLRFFQPRWEAFTKAKQEATPAS